MKREALSTSLSVLLVLFIIQFLAHTALYLPIKSAIKRFSKRGASLIDPFARIFAGRDQS